MLSSLNDVKRALKDFSKALECNPHMDKTYFSRGQVQYYSLKNIGKAILDFSAAIELNASVAEYFIERGRARLSKKQFRDAREDFSDAIYIDSTSAIAFTLRGDAKSGMRGYHSAIKDFTRSIEIDSTNAWTFFLRGNAWKSLEKYDRSLVDYSKAIDLETDFLTAKRERGISFVALGNLQYAFQDLEFVLLHHPKDSRVLFFLGKAHYDNSQWELAQSYFDMTIEIKPTGRAHYLRGMCKIELNLSGEACIGNL